MACTSFSTSLPFAVVDVVTTTAAAATLQLPLPTAKTIRFRAVGIPRRGGSDRTDGFLLRINLDRTRFGLAKLNAGLSEVEPDLLEDERDRWATGGISPDDFVFGEYDGHHTYFETGEKPPLLETLKEEYSSAEPPSGFQGLISWLFFPAVITALANHVQGEYIYIGAAIFVVTFCAIEMGKPDKPHNFEPQIYNMERESRDKLISDYNTMDIWDFNEKYGDLWDFTVKRDKL